MPDKKMLISLETLNKLAAYLSTKPWNEANPLLSLLTQLEEYKEPAHED